MQLKFKTRLTLLVLGMVVGSLVVSSVIVAFTVRNQNRSALRHSLQNAFGIVAAGRLRA